MKRILRSFLTLLMLVVWASGFAADKTYSYTFKSGGSFTGDKPTQTFNGVKWTIKTDGYLGFEASSHKAQQIGKKNAPAKNTEISTSDFSGTIKSVKINGWNGQAAKANVEVFVGNVSYGTKNFTTDKTSEYLFNGTSSGALKIKITNNVTSGAVAYYIKTISVTYEDGPTKTPTTLTFPKSTINIEEGNEATFTGQTATLKTGETVLNKVVTYTTNNDAMFEAYEANVGPKALKAGAYGTAVVTAKFNGDDTYAASTATYTVNYTEKAKPATTLDFGFATKTVNINETFTATAALKAGETTISGNVTYTSSKTGVATVNETTGTVSALTAGTTKITATFAGTSEYKSSTAYYYLTVVDPNATEVTFDFSKPADYGYEAPGSGSATNLEEGEKIQSGVITITNIKSGKSGSNTNKARFHNKGGNITFRVYANGEITLSAQPGYTITKFVFASSQGGYLTVSPGTYDSEKKTWEGNAQSISLAFLSGKDATFFKTMTVTYSKVAANPTLTLDEKAEDTEDVLLNTESSKVYDVTLTRTLTANVWNTICLPFDVTAEQIADVLKSAGNVKEFDREDATKQTIYFKDATTMVAGKPYLIKPTESAKELVFKGVKITAKSADASLGSDYGVFGIFGKYTMKTDGTELFLKTDGKFYVPAEGKETMKGFRAYFLVPKNTTAAALNLSFGDATGINGVAADAEKNVKVYNVNGQYVGTNLEALPKGLYIVGGKKVLK